MVITIRNKKFPSNTYLLKSSFCNNCIVIDPGLDWEEIYKHIINNNLMPIAILCTHGHFDHIASVAKLKRQFDNIPYYLHIKDAKIAKSANFYLRFVKVKFWIEYVVPDYFFENPQEEIVIDGFNFSIYQYPGHSEGSCVIKYENLLFTGDIIYKKGLGFNSFPGENTLLLKESVINILNSFDNGCLVYPGHGESDYLGNIKSNNLDLINFINN